MSLVMTALLAAAGAGSTLPHCSWDRPGVNPFMGNVVAAVDRYPDIPAATRAKLKARMAQRQYDEIVDIKRDTITGRYDYSAEIRDMHFGAGSVCRTVTRTRWTPATLERGLVYCEDGQCILVPTVCRNVSRITRGERKPVAMAQAPETPQAEDTTPLLFDPPAAGAGDTPAGDPGSFARTSALPTSTAAGESLIGGPGTAFSSGGTSAPIVSSPGLITLPQPVSGGLTGPTNPPVDAPVNPPATTPDAPSTPTPGTPPVNPPVNPPVMPPIAPPPLQPAVPAVPEPGTYALFALGLAALVALRRRQR